MAIVFQEWPKIPRFSAAALVTEKLDGTNACVVIDEEGTVAAQSRSRLIRVGDDNFGFAAWVELNKAELLQLGPGHHFGEWYGRGIQRGYGLLDRRFALFNVRRWRDCHGTNDHWDADQEKKSVAPSCCYVVPVIAEGPLDVALEAGRSAASESRAVRGFDKPEGFIVGTKQGLFKVIYGSVTPKSLDKQQIAEAA